MVTRRDHMQVVSVNIASPRTQVKGEKAEVTGIFKVPASGPVKVGALGIAGDFIGDAEFHGGPDQAVYIYGSLDYEWWASALAQDLEPGTFGENLTMGGLESASVHVGDRLHIGGVTIEVSAPRHPCSTLSHRMGNPSFVKLYRRAERPGCYARVIRAGDVSAGEPVELESYQGEAVTILELFRDHYRRRLSAARIRRYLRTPISVRLRTELESKLDRLTS